MAGEQAPRAPKVLYLLSHPIQYQSPLLRFLTASGRVHVHTLYTRRGGVDGYFDSGFGERVSWDVPLTEGHSHEFLPPLGGLDRESRLLPWSTGLIAAARRFSPDAVWLHGYDHANAVRLAAWARRNRVPVLVRAEVEDSDAYGGAVTRRVKDAVLRRAYERFDAFLAIGQRNRDFYTARGVPAAKIFSAPYAVDNEAFAGAARESAARPLWRQFDLPDDAPVFLFVGKMLPRKRPLDAIHALARLRDVHDTTASLVFVGSGELLDEARRTTTELGLDDRIRFAGFLNQTELAGLYGRAAALLLTSERERWGLVANEAMAGGCPVLVSDAVGCANDLVVDGVSGRVVPCGDVAALARAMADLCDADRRQRLRAGAAARVAAFSFAAIEAGLLDALGDVLPGGRGA